MTVRGGLARNDSSPSAATDELENANSAVDKMKVAKTHDKPDRPDHAGCPTCGQARGRNLFRQKAMIDTQEFANALAFDSDLTAQDVRVAVALLGELDFENRLPVSQAELARQLGTSPEAMNRHFKRLRAAGVLVDAGRGPGGHRLLRFNAAYVWKGRAGGHGRYFHGDKKTATARREAGARRRRAALRAVEGGAERSPALRQIEPAE